MGSGALTPRSLSRVEPPCLGMYREDPHGPWCSTLGRSTTRRCYRRPTDVAIVAMGSGVPASRRTLHVEPPIRLVVRRVDPHASIEGRPRLRRVVPCLPPLNISVSKLIQRSSCHNQRSLLTPDPRAPAPRLSLLPVAGLQCALVGLCRCGEEKVGHPCYYVGGSPSVGRPLEKPE